MSGVQLDHTGILGAYCIHKLYGQGRIVMLYASTGAHVLAYIELADGRILKCDPENLTMMKRDA